MNLVRTYRKKSLNLGAEEASSLAVRTLVELHRDKPVVVEAIQVAFDTNTISCIGGFTDASRVTVENRAGDHHGSTLKVATPSGVLTAYAGQYVVKVGFDYHVETPIEFESTYEVALNVTPPYGLRFGAALEALEQGKRVARAGWNEFLFLLPAGDGIPTRVIHDPALRKVIETELGGDTFDALASVRLFTADKKVLTGWVPTAQDMFARDWEIL